MYEPSVDDIRHMEEMEKEKRQKEEEEKAKQQRMKKFEDQFDNPTNQWHNDQSEMGKKKAKAEAEKPRERQENAGEAKGENKDDKR